ncbi:aspartate-semialdehyde dehydrogenase, partial [Gammaproteobacteria bacterium]|nr:aspartate-semialdehyde dehydrogenase [Gammaproteobacteria bacterium]
MALVGASGVVGQKILQLLQKKDIKIDNLFPLGKSTVGQTISFQNKDYIIG